LKVDRRKPFHIEEISSAKMLVALRVAGIYRGRINVDIDPRFTDVVCIPVRCSFEYSKKSPRTQAIAMWRTLK